MKFTKFNFFLLPLVSLSFGFVLVSGADESSLEIKPVCMELEEDGYCNVELFRCYMQKKCPKLCGPYDGNCDDDSEHGRNSPSWNGEDEATSSKKKRKGRKFRARNKFGKKFKGFRWQEIMEMGNESPKEHSGSFIMEPRSDSAMREDIMPRRRTSPHQYSEVNHQSKPRYNETSEDRLYCNDFKELGFCVMKIFECFMRKQCAKSCGNLPDNPNSATSRPKPVTTKREPASTTPKPVTIEPEPASTTQKPVIIQPEPASTTPKPVIIQPEPASTTQMPVIIQPEPASTTPKPVIIESEPITTKPVQTVGSIPSAANVAFTQGLVLAHNELRALHSAPNLKSDNSLILDAQKWANHLAAIDQLRHDRSGTGSGENLAWSSGNINAVQAVTLWYNEVKYYKYSTPGFTMKTGHFTQVVWKSTTLVGGAFAKSKSGGTYIVARYKPPGNVEGQFAANVLPLKSSG